VSRRCWPKRADVNAPSKDGSTALLWAVYNGNLEMVRALVAAQAKVDTPNRFGVTPLLQASRTGDAAIIARTPQGGRQHVAHSPGRRTRR
jgi:ankyrin repeat protein